MKIEFFKSLCLFTIFSFALTFATHELRTPLSLQSKLNLINGSFHYPIKPIDDEKTNVDLWAGVYYRHACGAYCPKTYDWCCLQCNDSCATSVCNNSCCSSCSSSGICLSDSDYIGCVQCNNNKVSLAKLFFGKVPFLGSEAFSSGVEIEGNNALVLALSLNPKVEYKEKGVVIGVHLDRKIKDKNWRVGFSASIPIKSIGVIKHPSCGDACCLNVKDGSVTPEDLGDKIFYKYEILEDTLPSYGNSALGETYGYRLDFLSELKMPNGVDDLVVYTNGSVRVADVELAALLPLTDPAPQDPTRQNRDNVPAVAYRRDSSKMDPTDVSLLAVRTSQLGTSFFPDAVPGNGNFSDGEKRWFSEAENYTALGGDVTQQEKIFIIPTYYVDSSVNNNMYEDFLFTNSALKIKNVVDYLIRKQIHDDSDEHTHFESPEVFFASKGACINDSQCATGLGDLDVSIFVGHDFTERSYLELVGGVRFPTGKKNTCPGKIFFVPTGNNGHFEAKIGLDGGWRSRRWFAVSGDISYSHVFEATEKRAAAFLCAKVRGIGPCVDARVRWGYFLGHLDLTVFHPKNQKMGFAFGYEIYYKRCDKVCFCICDGSNKVRDFLGNLVNLDSGLLEMDTNILSHKIRGQAYHRWNYFELYAGVSKVVAGWNGMTENEVYVGCSINF